MNVYCSLAVQGERRSYLNYQSKCSPLIFEYFNTSIQSVFLWFIKKTNKQKITNLKRSLNIVSYTENYLKICMRDIKRKNSVQRFAPDNIVLVQALSR